ncbi:MAG: hypothetical protein EAZ20_00135 [Bacteroidetes bacterium]|nr:MAG: hypothetical protein EAZ20_00135 [Bacteroidota bacterium]
MKKIIYESSADDMQKIRAFITDGKILDNKLKNNDVIKIWQKNKDLDAIDYLFFAKTCEMQAAKPNEWGEENTKKDMEKIKWLADAGKKYYNEKGSNPFLKIRFAYQALRMAHYSKQYDKVIRFYDEMVKPIEEKTTSVIKYWALSHKAGALYSKGNIGESLYLFSRIFDLCPSKQASSYLSIKIYGQNDWDNAMGLCKNNDEKATLYFIRSLATNANGVEEIKNVYDIAPKSEKLPYMLAREINKLEYDLLDIDLNKNLLFVKNYQGDETANAIKKAESLKSFISFTITENKLKNLEIFRLGGAYLEYVTGKPAKAKAIYQDIASKTKDEYLKNKINVFQLALQISELKNVDDSIEEDIYPKVKATNHRHLLDFTKNAFSKLYQNQGNVGKAFILKNDVYNLKTNGNLAQVNSLLDMVAKKKMTTLEKDMLKEKLTDKNPEQDLNEMKATFLFAEDKLEEAIKAYQSIAANKLKKIENDPFQIHTKDCFENCPPSTEKGKYNRMTLAQKILNLKKLTEKNNLEQGQYLLQLGTAYYNISHFGNSWEAIDYYRSGTDFSVAKEMKTNPNTVFRTNIYAEMSKAKYYFERAITAFTKTNDNEMLAQALMMAGRCEQNIYYLDFSGDSFSFIPPTYDPKHRKSLLKLKKELKDTKAFKDLRTTCLYFRNL